MFLRCSFFFAKSEADVLREHCCLNFYLSQCFQTSPLAANSEWRGLWSNSIDTRFKKPHNPAPAPLQALTYTETWYTDKGVQIQGDITHRYTEVRKRILTHKEKPYRCKYRDLIHTHIRRQGTHLQKQETWYTFTHKEKRNTGTHIKRHGIHKFIQRHDTQGLNLWVYSILANWTVSA